MFKEFKEFAMRGNVVDMAVGIIIGAAFGSIVKSVVADIIMPPIGLLLGDVDFSNLFVVIKQGAVAGTFATVAEAQKAGAVTINYGMFINTIISFLIVAFAVFLLIKGLNTLKIWGSSLRLTFEDIIFNMFEAVFKFSILLQLCFHACNRAADRAVLV